MKITFLGATRMVTGSCYLIETEAAENCWLTAVCFRVLNL